MTVYMTVILLTVLLACEKTDPLPPKDNPPIIYPHIFEKVWKTRIYEAPLENIGSDNAYIYNGVYIVTGDGWSHPDPTLYAFDVKTGEKKWELKQSGRYIYPVTNLVGIGSTIIIADSRGIAAYDLEEKKLLWEDIHRDKDELGLVGEIQIFDDYVYRGISVGTFYGPAKIVRYQLQTGYKEEIINLPLEGIWSPQLSPPSFWIDNNNDTIMTFINAKNNIDHSPQTSPTDLWTVNLSTKKIVWKIESIMEVSCNMSKPLIVYNDDVIFGGDRSIYSVDIPTAKVNWRTQFSNLGMVGNFNSTGLLLVGDRVFANPDAHDVMCLNAATGAVNWHNKTDAPSCTPNMLYNDDMLIFTSWGFGSVMILDPKTGQKIHKERSEKIYTTDVLYDKTTDMYFVQDYASAVGFKINKPK